MGIPHISDELITFAKLVTLQPINGVIACVAGTTLDFTTYAALINTTAQTTTLTRRPASSVAAIVSHAFVSDPTFFGEFDVTVGAVGKSLSLRVVTVPAAFLTTRVNVDQTGVSSPPRTLTLANILAWAQLATLAQVSAALEVSSPALSALWAIPGATAALSVG